MSASDLSRLDGAAIWSTLSAETQAKIGAVAIELVGSWFCSDELGARLMDQEGVKQTPWGRAANHFNNDADLLTALDAAVCEAVAFEIFYDGGTPRLPSLFGKICRACGCSDNDACAPACSWVDDDLCSECPVGEAPMPAERRQINISVDDRVFANLTRMASAANMSPTKYAGVLFDAAYAARFGFAQGDVDLDAALARSVLLAAVGHEADTIAEAVGLSEATVRRICDAWRDEIATRRAA